MVAIPFKKRVFLGAFGIVRTIPPLTFGPTTSENFCASPINPNNFLSANSQNVHAAICQATNGPKGIKMAKPRKILTPSEKDDNPEGWDDRAFSSITSAGGGAETTVFLAALGDCRGAGHIFFNYYPDLGHLTLSKR